MTCKCTHCQMGLPQHCQGPDAAAKQSAWKASYSEACAELVYLLGTGDMPSGDAFEQFKALVRALPPLGAK